MRSSHGLLVVLMTRRPRDSLRDKSGSRGRCTMFMILKSEGTTLKNRTNIQSDIPKRNSDIKPESLLKIKCENDLITPSQIIDPITAINLKIKGGYSFVHVVSMVNHGFNEAQSQQARVC